MNRVQRRTALKLFGATAGGIAAQFSGLVPELFAAGKTDPRADITWGELSAAEVRAAVGDALASADGRQLAAYAAQTGFAVQPDAARGIAVRTRSTTGTMVLVPFTAAGSRTGQLLYASAAGRSPAVAIGFSDGGSGGRTNASAFAVQGGQIRATDTTVITGNSVTITDERTGVTKTVTIPRTNGASRGSAPAVNTINFAAVAAADSCTDCETVFDFLYGLGCTLTSFLLCLACSVLTGPAGFICGAVCAIFWFLVCYLAIQLNRCSFCRYVGYCYAC